jgi:hypothetical protein
MICPVEIARDLSAFRAVRVGDMASSVLPSTKMEERSTIRWQHRLKREHPTGTERNKNRSMKSADGRVATVVATRQEKKLV